MNETAIAQLDPYGLTPDTDTQRLQQIRAAEVANRSGDWSVMFPAVEVRIPVSQMIKCPMIAGDQVIQARDCERCGHFGVIRQKGWSNEPGLEWQRKYFIECRFPRERHTIGCVTLPK